MIEAVEKHGKNFKEIANYVKTRDSGMCYRKVQILQRDGKIKDMKWENRRTKTYEAVIPLKQGD